jgi:hypothetical protein
LESVVDSDRRVSRTSVEVREDKEGPDDRRWRCLNAFWAGAVGRRVAVSRGPFQTMDEGRREFT